MTGRVAEERLPVAHQFPLLIFMELVQSEGSCVTTLTTMILMEA
jgi:hypothetical protein